MVQLQCPRDLGSWVFFPLRDHGATFPPAMNIAFASPPRKLTGSKMPPTSSPHCIFHRWCTVQTPFELWHLGPGIQSELRAKLYTKGYNENTKQRVPLTRKGENLLRVLLLWSCSEMHPFTRDFGRGRASSAQKCSIFCDLSKRLRHEENSFTPHCAVNNVKVQLLSTPIRQEFVITISVYS